MGATEKCETGIIGTIKNAGVENAGLEISAPNCMDGKCGTKQLWKAKTPAGLEVLLLLLTCYGSQNDLIICQNLQCSYAFILAACTFVEFFLLMFCCIILCKCY